jgi:HJR/Mrr/RecB family endonuclease
MRIIEFEKTDEASGLVYRDAIWLTDDDQSSDAEIEEMKTTRFQNWLAAIQPVEE